MRCRWRPEELDLHWNLLPQEHELLRNKMGIPRLGFAALLKSFQLESRFPEDAGEIPSERSDTSPSRSESPRRHGKAIAGKVEPSSIIGPRFASGWVSERQSGRMPNYWRRG